MEMVFINSNGRPFTNPFSTANHFFWTNLLGVSVGFFFAVVEGLSKTCQKKQNVPSCWPLQCCVVKQRA